MSDRTLAQYADLLRNDFAAFAQRAFAELHGTKEFKPNWHIDYADTIIRRFAKVYDIKARHVESGQSFEDIACAREVDLGEDHA
jgi:hypothetical protein